MSAFRMTCHPAELATDNRRSAFRRETLTGAPLSFAAKAAPTAMANSRASLACKRTAPEARVSVFGSRQTPAGTASTAAFASEARSHSDDHRRSAFRRETLTTRAPLSFAAKAAPTATAKSGTSLPCKRTAPEARVPVFACRQPPAGTATTAAFASEARSHGGEGTA